MQCTPIFVLMPRRVPIEAVYVDYPEIWQYKRRVVKIADVEDTHRLRGFRDIEFIWYAGGPDHPEVCRIFDHLRAVGTLHEYERP